MNNEEYILQMKGICKFFPGVKALNGVNLNLKKKSVHALCGENGAGKSTLMKVLSGVYRPDDGELWIDGKKVSFNNTKDSFEHGIAMVYQELSPIPEMTIVENCLVQ
ncbi:MAG: ATP-binding cassette domain-containing protein [Candidatus Alectryocaccobium sp.]|nr:ATP-binding cassette domain-containing protein [Candidatus Alectryocaccobium sp.]